MTLPAQANMILTDSGRSTESSNVRRATSTERRAGAGGRSGLLLGRGGRVNSGD